jgi:hypothetical protein
VSLLFSWPANTTKFILLRQKSTFIFATASTQLLSCSKWKV